MRRSEEGKKVQRCKGAKVVKAGALMVVALVAWEYARSTYVTLEVAQIWVYGLGERPYVFRTLVPWAARPLVWLGLREDVALSTVVIFSAIGLVYGIKYFISSFRAH